MNQNKEAENEKNQGKMKNRYDSNKQKYTDLPPTTYSNK